MLHRRRTFAVNQNRLKPVLITIQHYLVRPERPNIPLLHGLPRRKAAEKMLSYTTPVQQGGTGRDGTGRNGRNGTDGTDGTDAWGRWMSIMARRASNSVTKARRAVIG